MNTLFNRGTKLTSVQASSFDKAMVAASQANLISSFSNFSKTISVDDKFLFYFFLFLLEVLASL